MDAIRDSVPVEKILRAYVAQTEEPVNEEGDGTPLPAPVPAPKSPLPPPTPSTTAPQPKVPAPQPTPTIQTKEPDLSINTPVAAPSEPDPEPIKLVVEEPKTEESAMASALSVPSPRTDAEAANAVMAVVDSLPGPRTPTAAPVSVKDPTSTLSFANDDRAMSTGGEEEIVNAPKDDQGLREAEQRREAKEAAAAPPVDDEPIALAIKEMGGVEGLPDVDLGIEDIEVLA